MRTSMICTVINEEKNIQDFIESIQCQTKRPDELIVVDGGSKDRTFEILKENEKKFSWIKTYQLDKSNISQGRNFAIKKSSGDIIFTSDCSTIFEKQWVEKISNGFSTGADVVFGRYSIKPKNIVEKYLTSRLPNWKRIDVNKFLPSNRHVAYRKSVWERVGGYPEHLRRADDNWFHSRSHELGFKYYFVENASVQWILNRNLKTMLKLSFLDSKSEGFSGLFMKRKIYLIELFVLFLFVFSIFLGIIINMRILYFFLLFFLLIFLYEGFLKTFRKLKKLGISFLGIFLSIGLYFAHVFGLVIGIIQRIYRREE